MNRTPFICARGQNKSGTLRRRSNDRAEAHQASADEDEDERSVFDGRGTASDLNQIGIDNKHVLWLLFGREGVGGNLQISVHGVLRGRAGEGCSCLSCYPLGVYFPRPG